MPATISCSCSAATTSRSDGPRPRRWFGAASRALATAGLVLAAGFAAAAPVDEIRALLARGDAKGAYERAKRYPDLLGEPAFDYHFGIAAIDAGHPAEGTLALERYVITYPNDRTARLELARGYFVAGDDVRAREEFEGVMKTDPPPLVRANVDGYLAALRQRESRHRTTLAFFAEAGAGYDTNVNGGVGSANVTLPIGPVIVQAAGVKRGDGFLAAAGGLQLNIPVTPDIGAFVAVSGDTKNHFSEDAFDLRSMAIAGGGTYRRQRDLFRVTATAGTLLLDNTRFRDLHGLTAEWQRQLAPATLLNAVGSYAQLGYTGGNAARDADLYSLGIGLRQGLVAPWDPVVSGMVNVGRERNRRSRDDLARDFYGLRAGAQGRPTDRLELSAAATLLRSEYLEADGFLGSTRRDWYTALELTAAWTLTREWSLRGELVTSRNASSVALYEYTRDLALVKLRYETR